MEFINSNKAIVRASLDSGLKFFAGYPITPASSIMHSLSKSPISFVHAEDEIAAINMVIGASIAGAKSMTSTSGPGFSLMQESIGYAHAVETPLVVVDVQRVGPSTGMPTLPSQGDILQSAYGSHGDIFNIVFYPNSVEESYNYTVKAFNAAEESSSPVILLSDGFLANLYESVNLKKQSIINKKKDAFGTKTRHFTGLISEGDQPRTRDSSAYKKWIKKVNEKITKTAAKYNFYEYLEADSDTLLIAYGITSRIIYTLKSNYSIFRPIRIFPVIDDLKKISKSYKNIIVIEMNEGQYSREVERLLKRDISLIRIRGGYLSLKEIKDELQRLH